MTDARPQRVEVAVGLPVTGTFTYGVPPGGPAPVVGSRVLVPFGNRAVTGLVVALDPPVAQQMKDVRAVLGDAALDAGLVDLLLWAARYYQVPPGEMLRAAVPAGLDVAEAPMLSLTERGRAVSAGEVSAGALPPGAIKLLGALAAARGGRLPVARARAAAQATRPGALEAAASALIAAGLIERGDTRKDARVREKKVDWVRLLRPPEAEDLAALARAKRCLTMLEVLADGERPVTTLGKGARPALKKLQERGLVEVEARESLRDPFLADVSDAELAAAPRQAPPPTPGQAAALAALGAAVAALPGFKAFLLHGVTGSGKTEVYLQTIAEVLASGRTAIVLVPEISLTPQLSARFRARFGEQVAVLHSGLGPGERFDQWRRLKDGRARIALGARSAVFAPVERLGCIVVDEEHDGSFKQEEEPRYHARDLALVRAQRAGALCVLGSATPSLESHLGARQGRLHLLELPERPTARVLPSIEVVDLRKYRTGDDSLSAPLRTALQQTLDAGEQAILFINRRGFAASVICFGCGEPVRCRDCSVSLTWHRAEARLMCHYCGYSAPPAKSCASCGATHLEPVGIGTEKVEAMVSMNFPRARVGRLDRDTAKGRGLAQVLGAFRRRELDIVVGTQLVTKGHDFPGVTLVGVLSADVGLSMPDFRAAEKTFQLLTQVAGRAGRGDRPGRVIIQTYHPEHAAIVCTQTGDFAGFAATELEVRDELAYPPHGRLIALRIDGPEPARVLEAASALGARARELLAGGAAAAGVTVLGPAEAPLARLRGRTRWHLYVKARERAPLRAFVERLLAEPASPGVRIGVDVDPVSAL
ncbi:MAG: primosomal protein N' [Deltaproteobacteria bacterium]|nr:primosomal protein N' [Deltaproteobacteria bacterium]